MGRHRWHSCYAQGSDPAPTVYLTKGGQLMRRDFDGEGVVCIAEVGRDVEVGSPWPSRWAEATGIGAD
jgi:hypothetical protein